MTGSSQRERNGKPLVKNGKIIYFHVDRCLKMRYNSFVRLRRTNSLSSCGGIGIRA